MAPIARRRYDRPVVVFLRRIAASCFVIAIIIVLLYARRHIPSLTSGGSSRGQDRRLIKDTQPKVCFVIRTYWGHGSKPTGSGSLEAMLRTFMTGKHRRWEALLVVMDSVGFKELHSIVKKLRDKRITIFAEKIGPEYAAKQANNKNAWNPIYHELLYNLTDVAIRGCPEDTRWVAITNGDNAYDPGFLEELIHVPPNVDVTAFNYYSRYQRPTARPCERFAAGPDLPFCKENALHFCNTDLGANVINWKRMMAENRTFGSLPSLGMGLNDGLMAESLIADGWKVHTVSDKCLYSHSPNPQMCALRGGVWDDSTHGFFPLEDPCISESDAKAKMEADDELDMVDVKLSTDGKSFGLSKRSQPLVLKCITPSAQKMSTWQNKYYPPQCIAPVDTHASTPHHASTSHGHHHIHG